ncbi:hypothetical protein TRFO_09200 [Tritrichomonas foetus]|uniref:Uncharacterized protein n=1 Tax=Tritrichomonas foetus TaxID=1144522 RepID=A0A1J4JJT7_9EUKA|nr:hypothetical protein TRFO_09200 [Tritrichomonas foetus]|eukprot:OHS97787.1 hypothetical protein TRFO_09200 [Tritrichomonas foetus]
MSELLNDISYLVRGDKLPTRSQISSMTNEEKERLFTEQQEILSQFRQQAITEVNLIRKRLRLLNEAITNEITRQKEGNDRPNNTNIINHKNSNNWGPSATAANKNLIRQRNASTKDQKQSKISEASSTASISRQSSASLNSHSNSSTMKITTKKKITLQQSSRPTQQEIRSKLNRKLKEQLVDLKSPPPQRRKKVLNK